MRVRNFGGSINNRRHRALVRLEEHLAAYEKAVETLRSPEAKSPTLMIFDKIRDVENCEFHVKRIKAELLTLDKRIVAQPVAESQRTKKDRSGMGRIRRS